MTNDVPKIFVNGEHLDPHRLHREIDRQALILNGRDRAKKIIFGGGLNLLESFISYWACKKVGLVFAPGASPKNNDEAFGLVENGTEPGFALLFKSSGSVQEQWCVLCEDKINVITEIAIRANDMGSFQGPKRVFSCASISHIAGWLIHLVPAMTAGLEIHLEPFSPFRFLQFVAANDDVVTHLTPGQARALELTKYWRQVNFAEGSRVLVGSSEVHSRLVKGLLDRGASWVQVNYGLTELGPYVSGLRIQKDEPFPKLPFPTIGSLYEKSGFDYFIDPNSKSLFLSHPKLVGESRFMDTGDCVEEFEGNFTFLGRRAEAGDLLQYGFRPLDVIEDLQKSLNFFEPAFFLMGSDQASVFFVVRAGRRFETKKFEIERYFLKAFPQTPIKIVPVGKIPITENGKMKRLSFFKSISR